MKLFHLDWERSHKQDFNVNLTFPVGSAEKVLVEGDKVFDSAKAAFDSGFYTEVAEIDGDDLEFAFRYTQNIEESWSDPPMQGVKPIGQGPFRSTSVGDIVEQDGVFQLVCSMGYKELQDFHPAPTPKV
jgi:hypothetical protein